MLCIEVQIITKLHKSKKIAMIHASLRRYAAKHFLRNGNRGNGRACNLPTLARGFVAYVLRYCSDGIALVGLYFLRVTDECVPIQVSNFRHSEAEWIIRCCCTLVSILDGGAI